MCGCVWGGVGGGGLGGGGAERERGGETVFLIRLGGRSINIVCLFSLPESFQEK